MTLELYLRQRLADYEPERVLLERALDTGVPERLLRSERGDTEATVRAESARFAKTAGVAPAAAWWATAAWAAALGQPVGSTPPPPVAPPRAAPALSDRSVRRVMATIVAAGGFLRAAIGISVVPLLIAADFAVPAAQHKSRAPTDRGRIAAPRPVWTKRWSNGSSASPPWG